jgi:hypothetical protein
MKIQYEGEYLEFDLEEVTLAQATYLHKKLGLTLLGLDRGLVEGNPDALRAVWWLMQQQAGNTKVNIDSLDFKIVKLTNAIQEAYEAEQANKEQDPKEEDSLTLPQSGSSTETSEPSGTSS